MYVRMQQMRERYRLCKIFVKPRFSYTLLNIRIPTYAVNTLAINLELAEYPKNKIPVTQYKQEFLRLCATTYGDFQKLYTDSSKREAGVGAAVVGLGRVRKATLPREGLYLVCENSCNRDGYEDYSRGKWKRACCILGFI